MTTTTPDNTPNGIIIIDKPPNMTSHDIVYAVRRTLKLKKVGHAGTLDPLATGVLPIYVGKSTRVIEFMPDDKRYLAQIQFGKATTTWDGEGDVTHETDASGLTQLEVIQHLDAFRGLIQQTVPLYSAVHVNGKKLYQYAREGKADQIEALPTRAAEIFDIKLAGFDTSDPAYPIVSLDIHCASGTYVRSIAHELGEKLGYGGYLCGLIRTAHGRFPVEEALSLEAFQNSANPQQYLKNPLYYLPYLHLDLGPDAAWKSLTGQRLSPSDYLSQASARPKSKQYVTLATQGILLAIGQTDDNANVRVIKAFTTPEEVFGEPVLS